MSESKKWLIDTWTIVGISDTSIYHTLSLSIISYMFIFFMKTWVFRVQEFYLSYLYIPNVQVHYKAQVHYNSDHKLLVVT